MTSHVRRLRWDSKWKLAIDAMEINDSLVMKREIAVCAHAYFKRHGKDSTQVSLKKTNGNVRFWRIK